MKPHHIHTTLCHTFTHDVTQGRVQAHEVLVPEETSLARKLQQYDEEQRIEQQRIKERVLQYQQMGSYETDEPPLADTILSRPYQQPITNESTARRKGGRNDRERRDGMGLDDFLNETRQAETRRLQTRVRDRNS